MRTLTVPALAAALLVLAAPAAASPEYPGKLQELLDLGCVPQCTICHQTNSGGIGSIREDSFGAAMVNLGDLDDEEPGALQHALDELELNLSERDIDPADGEIDGPVDTDGDGMSDVTELRALRDPNTEGAGEICGPLYGCGAAVAPPRGPAQDRAFPVLAALGTALFLASRLRRRARPH